MLRADLYSIATPFRAWREVEKERALAQINHSAKAGHFPNANHALKRVAIE
jgi:hypothetical protein